MKQIVQGITRIVITFMLMLSVLAYAGAQPKFTISPTTPVTKQVPLAGHDIVQYLVTNNTNVTRTLTMVPINGIHQIIGGGCRNPFTLTPKSSCFLTLELNGSQLPEQVTSGPEICKTSGPGDNTPTPYLCSQPSRADSLNLIVVPFNRTVVSIEVSPPSRSIPNGTNQQMTAIGVFADGFKANITNLVTWSSSNTSVATISNVVGTKGLASGKGQGTTTLTATLRNASGNTTLTVTAATLTAINITPTNPSIGKDTLQQFTATGTYSDNSTQNITDVVTWVSTNTSVATISNASGSQGLAEGINPGTTVINAQLNGLLGSTNLTVKPATLTSITVTPVDPSIPVTTTQQFTDTGNFSDGSTQDLTKIVVWTSSNSTVQIDRSGKATAGTSAGTSTITARLGLITGSTTLTVESISIVSINVTPANTSIAAGLTLQYHATGTFSNGQTYPITDLVHWQSSTPGVANIDSQGLVTGIAAGSTNISATLGSVSGQTPLTVTAAVLTAISVGSPNTTITSGSTEQYNAQGSYTDGSVRDITTEVNWSSSNANVASISNALNSEGLATATNTGSTTISATLSNIIGTKGLSVSPATLVSISVTPATASLNIGNTQQFIATGTYSDASTSDITNSVSWTSSADNVATVSNSSGSQGLATANAAGSAIITATSGVISDTATVTVAAPVVTLTSINITPASAVIDINQTLQYTAKGTYSNGSIKNITNQVVWTSSAISVATISNAAGSNGLVTATSLSGTTFINASLDGISGTARQLDVAAAITAYAYVTNRGTNQVLLCEVLSTGNLSNCADSGPGAIFSAPIGITINPAGTQAYVVTNSTDRVMVCDIQPNSGGLTNCINATQAGAVTNPVDIAINPAGTTAYITNDANQIRICSVNGNGTLSCTATFGASANVYGISSNSDGSIIYVTAPNSPEQVFACAINTGTGAITNCVTVPNPGPAVYDGNYFITVNSAGTAAYLSNFNGDYVSLCLINLSNGSFDSCSVTGNTGTTFDGSFGIAINPNTTFGAYGYIVSTLVNGGTGAIFGCPLNTQTDALGACREVSVSTFNNPQDIAILQLP